MITHDLPLFVIKIQAMSDIKHLSQQTHEKNRQNEPVTEELVDALALALATFAGTLDLLNKFKNKNSAKIPQLASIPIDDAKVASIKVTV